MDHRIAVLFALVGEAKAFGIGTQSIPAHDFSVTPLDQAEKLIMSVLHLIKDLPPNFAERLATSLDGDVVPVIDFTARLRKLAAQAFHFGAQERDFTDRIDF